MNCVCVYIIQYIGADYGQTEHYKVLPDPKGLTPVELNSFYVTVMPGTSLYWTYMFSCLVSTKSRLIPFNLIILLFPVLQFSFLTSLTNLKQFASQKFCISQNFAEFINQGIFLFFFVCFNHFISYLFLIYGDQPINKDKRSRYLYSNFIILPLHILKPEDYAFILLDIAVTSSLYINCHWYCILQHVLRHKSTSTNLLLFRLLQ